MFGFWLAVLGSALLAALPMAVLAHVAVGA